MINVIKFNDAMNFGKKMFYPLKIDLCYMLILKQNVSVFNAKLIEFRFEKVFTT